MLGGVAVATAEEAVGSQDWMNPPPAVNHAPHQTQPKSGLNTLPNYASRNPANQFSKEPAASQLRPVTAKTAGVNLFQIDQRQQIFSPVLLSPTRRWMAFTEMRYLSPTPQVFARAYIGAIPPSPTFSETPLLPEARYIAEAQAAVEQKRVLKVAKKQQRQTSANVICRWGLHCKDKAIPAPPPIDVSMTPANPTIREVYYADASVSDAQAFHSLIPVDWSQDGETVLLKHHSGRIYNGIDVTEAVTINAATGQVSTFSEMSPAVAYYWQARGIQPALNTLHWTVSPMGWQPGSSTNIELEAWAHLPSARMFLGHWRLDITTRAVQLITETYDPHWPVASNGALITAP